jgi:hypothetical protein
MHISRQSYTIDGRSATRARELPDLLALDADGERPPLADLRALDVQEELLPITQGRRRWAKNGWPPLLPVRVLYDGHKTPSVDARLGDFFGVGHGYGRNLNSMMVRNASFRRAPFFAGCPKRPEDDLLKVDF